MYRLCKTVYSQHSSNILKKATEARYGPDQLEAAKEDIGELLSNYEKDARGPAKLRVLATDLPATIETIVDRTNAQSRIALANIEKDYIAQKTQLEDAIEVNQKVLDELDNKKKENEVKVLPLTLTRFIRRKAESRCWRIQKRAKRKFRRW